MGLTVIELLQLLGYEYDARFTWSAAALVALGVLLATWPWLPARWRRLGKIARVCPRCNYDLRGIAEEAAFPLTCAECGLELESQRLLGKAPPTRRLLGIAALVVVAAHVTALWPQVGRVGWKRLIPSTVLVLQPMDVGEWTEAHLGLGTGPGKPLVGRGELSRRLNSRELWSWQEWVLFKRVERSCRARDDYGIMASQYDVAVALHTTPASAEDEETIARRLVRLAGSADVPFLVEWERLSVEGLDGGDLVPPAEVNATVARALEQLLVLDDWLAQGSWDITTEGVVVTGLGHVASTSRCRVYEVSDLTRNPEDSVGLVYLIKECADPDNWIGRGGTVNAAFGVSDHVVVVATTRTHLQIEEILDDLRDAVAAEPPSVPSYAGIENPRVVTEGGCPTGMLDDLRFVRSIPMEALRRAGPSFDDGVTEQELDACNRGAFGVLDMVRE
ncbi:MAG: hypothetical protein ACYTGT_21175 [Planctomycetota bacterium]|jgi:hypothetical protein